MFLNPVDKYIIMNLVRDCDLIAYIYGVFCSC
jgi:hypothetical protein